ADWFAVSPSGAFHVDDFAAATKGSAYFQELATVARVRSYAGVPLTHVGDTVGALHMYRHEVRPFTEDEISALATFGEQASLAIANARLFKDLGESLKLQTATSEVLQLISAHPGDLTAVMNGLTERARQLCGGDSSAVIRLDGTSLVRLADESHPEMNALSAPVTEELAAWIRDGGPTRRIDDLREAMQGMVQRGISPDDVRSTMLASLRVEGRGFGMISVSRREVRPFDEREARILERFAEQAAIAISNAKLFNDLDESLELQTATSEVLALISAHPGDLTAVLNGLIERAVRLCAADAGVVWRIDGDAMTFLASPRHPETVGTSRPIEAALMARLRAGETLRVDDMVAVAATAGRDVPSDVRSFLVAGLSVDGALYGMLGVNRHEVRPFDEREARILNAFGEQAAIAIGNAKLFNELDESLARQRAMTDVLDAVSTARFDLQPVFDRIVTHASRLCGRNTLSSIALRHDNQIQFAAFQDREGVTKLEWEWGDLDDASLSGATILSGKAITVGDWDNRPANQFPNSPVGRTTNSEIACFPMLRDGVAVGSIAVTRPMRGGYSDAEVSLLQAFANQAAVAVDNARLLREIERRNSDLAASLELQTAMAEVLRLISEHPGELRTVLQGILAQARRLCDADQGLIFLLRRDNDTVTVAAEDNPTGSMMGRVFPANKALWDIHQPVVAHDVLSLFAADDRSWAAEFVRQTGNRSQMVVPLVGRGMHLGNFILGRREVRPFTSAQATILQAFADQAVIAVTNAGLFNDLAESLARQEAMTDLLNAVSTARTDLTPVFDALARQADRLCGGTGALVAMRQGDGLVVMASAGFPAAVSRPTEVMPIDDSTVFGACARHREIIHIKNYDDEPLDRYPNAPSRRAGAKSALAIPMVRGDVALGVVAFSRLVPGGYTDAEVSLLKTFVDQAAVAVDNARLLIEIEKRNSELAESLELQTATGAILALISANPGNLRKVFDGIVAQAARLCDADSAAIDRLEGDETVLEATSYEHHQARLGRRLP
ncbi:MAG TPA: GAF domain-containing protein, partial [Caldimonas sp.]|nr:GAF domain-containing protein [Caldimonas sp.]